jgi:hypothetical protein
MNYKCENKNFWNWMHKLKQIASIVQLLIDEFDNLEEDINKFDHLFELLNGK